MHTPSPRAQFTFIIPTPVTAVEVTKWYRIVGVRAGKMVRLTRSARDVNRTLQSLERLGFTTSCYEFKPAKPAATV